MKSLLTFALLAAATVARAQGGYHVSFYAGVDVVHVSNADSSNSGVSPEQYAGFWKTTETGGATFHLANAGPVTLGLDLRGAGANNLTNFYLGEPNGYHGVGYTLLGIQVAYRNLKRIRPYVQGSYGIFSTFAPNAATIATTSYNQTYQGLEVFTGLDYHIIRFLDFRAIELGIGNAFHSGVFYTGPLDNITLFNITTGVVAHF